MTASPLATRPILRTGLLWVGLLVSFALALALNYELIFDAQVRQHYAQSPDSVAITRAALAANGAKVASWWAGPWVEGEKFYRPLSSMLMWAEAKLWGYNFHPYNLVSWLMHAGNTVLLFLLVVSLCPGPLWQRVDAGIIAALLFNLGKHPAGPYWIEARVAWGVMPWFPVQTDLGSLGAALLSLLLLDCYLKRSGDSAAARKWLFAALGVFLAALLFKETPLAIVPLVACLALYRRRSWLLPTLGYLCLGAALFALRALVVPHASNPAWTGESPAMQYILFVHRLTGELLPNGEIWELVAAAVMVALALSLARTKLSPVYIGLLCLACPFVAATVLAGNPALATIPRELGILVRYLGVLLGLALGIATCRREPLWLALVAVLCVAVPNINRVGPHYWYWPVAMWGMVGGLAANAACNWLRRWSQRPRPKTPAQVAGVPVSDA